jgi:hypothetical protein
MSLGCNRQKKEKPWSCGLQLQVSCLSRLKSRGVQTHLHPSQVERSIRTTACGLREAVPEARLDVEILVYTWATTYCLSTEQVVVGSTQAHQVLDFMRSRVLIGYNDFTCAH